MIPAIQPERIDILPPDSNKMLGNLLDGMLRATLPLDIL
jgi:hypothetical protein